MIKLCLSILLPVLFIGNYWICEWLYPGSGTDWAIFIPMDELCHNIWAVTIFCALGVSMMKTTYPITDLFLLFTINLSGCDVLDRTFGIYNYEPKRYFIALFISVVFALVLFTVNQRKR